MELTKKATGNSQHRRFRYGLNAVVLTIAIITIIVMANVVAGDFRLRVDTTRARQHSLSELTEQVIRGLEQEVDITVFSRDASVLGARLKDLAQEYAHRSRYISVHFIDPDRDPSQARAYGIEQPETTVFESGDRIRYVPIVDAYRMDQEIGLVEFTGEQAFTQALLSVVRDVDRQVYFTEGHDERTRNQMSLLRSRLSHEGVSTSTINLSREGGVPDDAELLIIVGPERDFDRTEADMLSDYLLSGGRLLAFIDPGSEPGDLPNLRSAMKVIGVEFDDVIIVDPVRSYFMDPLSPIPHQEYHPVTDTIIRSQLSVVLPYARSLRVAYDYEGELEHKRLLFASDNAWGDTDFDGELERRSYDLDPPLWLGMVVYRPGDANDGTTEAQAIIFGSSTFITDGPIEFQGNLDLVINSINYLGGEVEQVSIRSRDPAINRVFMSGEEARTVFYSCVFGLPGIVLISGIVVWLRRRTL